MRAERISPASGTVHTDFGCRLAQQNTDNRRRLRSLNLVRCARPRPMGSPSAADHEASSTSADHDWFEYVNNETPRQGGRGAR